MTIEPQSVEPNPAPVRGRHVGAVLAVLLALGLTFWLGRRSATPMTPPAPGEAPQEGGDEHAGEHNVVRFEERGLQLAGLRVEPVGTRALQPRLVVTGTVEPNLGGVVKITPRVTGKITSVLVNVGDNVRQGQSLASLASTELAQAQAAYRQAGARAAVATSNLQRQRKLAGLGEFGRHKVEEARGAAVAAQGDVNTAGNELAAARNEVAEARSEKAALEGEVAGAQAGVSSSESAIAEAEAQVPAAQAALAQAQTGVRVAQSRFNRYDTLLKEQLVSKQDWEQAQADHQRAQSDVEAGRANVSQAQAKAEAAKGALRAAAAKVRAAQGRVEQAAAGIESATARQAQVEAKLAAARKRAEIADQALVREEKIYRGGYLTSKEILDAEAVLRQAQAEQHAAADQVRLLGGHPGGGNTLTVPAPISGRITERSVTLGETVAPEKPLFTLVNLWTVWVQLNVYQKDLPSVRLGQAVRVTADAAPGAPWARVLNGAVSYIADQVDETTRTVKVRCVVQNPGDALKPQAFVRGVIAGAAGAPALAVPADAVQELDGRRVVFVPGEHAGEFQARPVELGDRVPSGRGEVVEVRSGLKPGERIVTKNAFLVKAQAMKGELAEE